MSLGGRDEQVDPELQRMMMVETQKAQFTENVHKLTHTCWEKCVDKIYNKSDSKVEKCVANCVDRFVDTSFFVANKLSQMGNR